MCTCVHVDIVCCGRRYILNAPRAHVEYSMSGANRASLHEKSTASASSVKSKEGSVVEIEGRGVLPHDYI